MGGSFPIDTVRLGVGALNTTDEADATLAAVQCLAREGQ